MSKNQINKKHWTQEEFDAWADSLPEIQGDAETNALLAEAIQDIKDGKGIEMKHSDLEKIINS